MLLTHSLAWTPGQWLTFLCLWLIYLQAFAVSALHSPANVENVLLRQMDNSIAQNDFNMACEIMALAEATQPAIMSKLLTTYLCVAVRSLKDCVSSLPMLSVGDELSSSEFDVPPWRYAGFSSKVLLMR